MIEQNEENMELFWNYIRDRHLLYKKKELEKLPPPWTDDWILNSFKFTNVFRDLDRGTKFVTNHIFNVYEEMSNPEDSDYELGIIFNVIMYRFFNFIDTYMLHGVLKIDEFYDRWAAIKEVLEEKQSNGIRVFTNAFVVSGYSHMPGEMKKVERIMTIIRSIHGNIVRSKDKFVTAFYAKNMEPMFNLLMSLDGIGKFLALQMAWDISYHNASGFTEDGFTKLGPGALRGVNHLFHKETTKGIKPEYLCFKLRDDQKKYMNDYRIDFTHVFSDRKDMTFGKNIYLSVNTIENCLCEFSKYVKAHTGQGRPRNRYDSEVGHDRYQQYMENEQWMV